MLGVTRVGFALLVLLLGGSAEADEVSRRARWDGGLIVTDVTTGTPDGRMERQTIIGGTVDGVGMLQQPLRVGLHPFVPTRNSQGTPVHWAGGCVFVRPDAADLLDVPGTDERAATQHAVGNWVTPTRACGYLQLVLEAPEAGEVGLDGVNRVIYRQDTWCRPGQEGGPPRCYDEGAIGLTTLFYVDLPGAPDDGAILDADIELNAVNYSFGAAGSGVQADLENILTHELGHFLGLDHTCWAGLPPAPLDGDGLPVPSCAPGGSLAPEVLDATMYPFSDPGETKKRSLEADDIEGFCARYPLASDPGTCAPVMRPAPDAGLVDAGLNGGSEDGMAGFGCHARGRPGHGGVGLSLIVLAMGLARLRCRR